MKKVSPRPPFKNFWEKVLGAGNRFARSVGSRSGIRVIFPVPLLITAGECDIIIIEYICISEEK